MPLCPPLGLLSEAIVPAQVPMRLKEALVRSQEPEGFSDPLGSSLVHPQAPIPEAIVLSPPLDQEVGCQEVRPQEVRLEEEGNNISSSLSINTLHGFLTASLPGLSQEEVGLEEARHLPSSLCLAPLPRRCP